MDPLIIAIIALLIPVVIVPTVLGIKHARFLREMEHTERMRAMELGRPLVDEKHSWTPSGIAVAIGAGVPIIAMGIAWEATRSFRSTGMANFPILESIWKTASMIGLGGVICGTILASQAFMRKDHVAPVPEQKPEFDPEAFDVVGRRG